ncbi:hypothetical protein ANANG_G00000240 [Anguilla anguilla]|uniref:Ig-like domain-containing protein n=1 Tax=Anguilla anguilla TaxID=7936 RepID=A0A9D3MVE5_ANGAN|nr:hypothetical protein ANANG_G00000240 [Anguilla anguilla]
MVTLTCKNTCTRTSTFEFYRNGQRLSNIVRNQFRARSDNAGNYSCRAVYNHFLYSNAVILRVKYPPKSISVSVSGEIVEGSSVTLTCSSDANPPVQSYTWYKNNRAVSSETGGPEHSYTIKNITLQDAGEYYCEAENEIGINKSSPEHLDVQYSPRNTSMSVSPSGEIVEGSSVTLTCSSDANPPVQRYTWYKNNRAVSSETGGPEHSYTIKTITLQDAGEYYCVAENAIRTNRSPPKRVNVLYAPKNTAVSVSPSGEIMAGSSVTLTCSSDANPPVQRYTWFKNNIALASWTGSGLNHTISNIVSEDSGQYYCETRNQHGTQNSSAAVTIDVQYLPKNTSVSVSPSGEIVEGRSMNLTCSSDANPPVQNYTWFKKNDTGVWQAGSGQSLNFSNFRSWNRGQYYCEAQNRLGAQNASALLVTVQGGRSLIAAAAVGVAAILALVFLGVVCVRRRKSTNETGHTEGDGEGNKSPIYGNVSGMAMSYTGTQGTDRDDGEVPLYSSVQPTNICNQEQVLYSTVQNPLTEYEEGVQYASIQFRPSSVAPRSKVQGAEDSCVIYSTVSNCNT